jgi:hypothetical protein
VIEPIFTGVIARVLGDVIKQAASSLRGYYNGRDYITMPERAALAKIVAVVDRELQGTQLGDLSAPGQQINDYLGSPECVTFFEHVLALKLAGRAIEDDGPLLVELKIGASLYGISDPSAARQIYRLLTHTADLVLRMGCVHRDEQLDPDSRLTSHRATVETYLSAIENHVRAMAPPEAADISELRETLEEYRQSIAGVLGRIQPPSFDGSQNVPIDSLYVSSKLTMQESRRSLEIDSLVHLSRTVVLGDPGGGKTTLAKKIATDLATGSMDIIRGNNRVVPFFIVLRDFAPEQARNLTSVSAYISRTVQSVFQVDLSVRAVDWILATGRGYVIFDGLDELLRTESRRKISDIVTAFCIRFPNTRVLVTSRRVGYMEAPLPFEVFDVVSLGGLEDDRVQQYVEKWFALAEFVREDDRRNVVDALIAESKAVSDLRSNPLMLALICTIYRSEGYIPRNRPDVYEKCSRMLFDRWDRHRGLLDPFEFEAHVEPALMYLAHSIFTNEGSQDGVPENALVSLAADYLNEWQYSDRVKAEAAAKNFVEFCRGRAWVFSDIGLSPSEVPLFQFTHRTFLEYFTAAHLARTSDSLSTLSQMLLPRVEAGEWDVVAQLAMQIRAKAVQGGPDAVLRSLLERINLVADSRDSLANIVSFTARSLSFLTVSPAAIQAAATELVDRTIDLAVNGREVNARDAFRSLCDTAREIRLSLCASLCRNMVERLGTLTGESLRVAAGLSWSFRNDIAGRGNIYSPIAENIAEVKVALWDAIRRHPKWLWGAVLQFQEQALSADELVSSLGTEFLLSDCEVPGVKIYLHPPVLSAIAHILYATCDGGVRCEEYYRLVVETARVLTKSGPIDFGTTTFGFDGRLYSRNKNLRRRHRALTSEEILSAGIVLATYFEASTPEGIEITLKAIGRTRLGSLKALFTTRRDVGSKQNFAAVPTGRYRDNLIDWACGRVNFSSRGNTEQDCLG